MLAYYAQFFDTVELNNSFYRLPVETGLNTWRESTPRKAWNTAEVYRLLERHCAAYCIYDLAGYQSPMEITTDFTYIRLHGEGGKYQGSYDRDALARWADRIAQWRERLGGVYVYFDNDDSGYAAANARELRSLCQ